MLRILIHNAPALARWMTSCELRVRLTMADLVPPMFPAQPEEAARELERVEVALAAAVREEDYAAAAQLRDRLK